MKKRIVAIATLITLTAMLATATEEQMTMTEGDAYFTGMEDGYRLGILFMQGQTNDTASEEYNDQRMMINGVLDKLNFTEDTRLGEFGKLIENYELPPIFS